LPLPPLPGDGIDVHAGEGFRIDRTVQIGIRVAMGDLRQDDWARNSGYRIIEIDKFNEACVL